MSKKTIIILVTVIGIIGLIAVISNQAQTNLATTESTAQVNGVTSKGTEIVFFWLPTGSPCQEQNKIITDLEVKNPNLKTTRVDLTDPANSSLANKYGIRSVPSVVILDGQSKIVKQFTPGIQSQENLKKYLN